MKIIDAHTHIFPPKIAAAATKATMSFYATGNTPLNPDASKLLHHTGISDDLLKCAKEAGIDQCVVFSAATTSKQVQSVNRFIAREVKDRPEFIGLGTMYVDYPDFEGECDAIVDLGLRGIKIHPDIQRFRIDDERLYPLYEIMADRHLFLIAHTGDNRFDYSGPERVLKVAKMFPDLKIVGAHFAGWSEWPKARKMLNNLDNIYMDTSSTIQFAGPEAALEAFKVFDPTHIFFGSDYPMWDPKEELDTILNLGLDDKTLEGVLHGNFEKFLEEL